MSNLLFDNATRPNPLAIKYEVLDGQPVKISVVIGNARSGTPFFFLDGETVITTLGEVTVTPRTVTFADGKLLRDKVLTVAANVGQGTAVGSDKWSMDYTITGGKPPTCHEVNNYSSQGAIVYFQDTITFS